MAGIGNIGGPTATPPASAAAPAEPRPTNEPAVAGEGAANVSPEEQGMYDQFVENAQAMIYPDGEDGQPTASPIILAHLRGEFEPEAAEVFANAEPPLSATPTDSLAATGVMLVLVLENSMAASGMPIESDTMDAIVFQGGAEILQDLVEVAEAAQIYDFSEDEMEAALYRAVDLYRVSSGRIDQAALTSQFEQIVAADKDGTLNQLLPGIGERTGGQG